MFDVFFIFLFHNITMYFVFQMNLHLIIWIGLISSVCCVFGQAGKKKKSFPVVFMLVSCITVTN